VCLVLMAGIPRSVLDGEWPRRRWAPLRGTEPRELVRRLLPRMPRRGDWVGSSGDRPAMRASRPAPAGTFPGRAVRGAALVTSARPSPAPANADSPLPPPIAAWMAGDTHRRAQLFGSHPPEPRLAMAYNR